MYRSWFALVLALFAHQAVGAVVTSFDEAANICLSKYPQMTSPVDDEARTFRADDRYNARFDYSSHKAVCSVGRTSGEIEEFKIGSKVFSKADLEAGEAAKARSSELGNRIAGGEYQEFLGAAKAKVADKFKDPDSAKFRGLYFSNKAGMPTLCGEVNAKNSYGAYVGYRGFYSNAGGSAVQTEDGRGTGLIYDNMAKEFCASKFKDVE